MKMSKERGTAALFLTAGLLAYPCILKAEGPADRGPTRENFTAGSGPFRPTYASDDSAPAIPPQPKPPATRKFRTLAFKGGPLSDCRWFLITENGLAADLDTRFEFLLPPPVSRYSWELGLMKNVTGRQAVGAAFYLSYDVEDEKSFLFAFKPRFRHWLSRRFHADAAAGIIFAQAGALESYQRADLPGFEGHVALGFADWASAGFHFEAVRLEPQYPSPYTFPGKTRKDWFVGLTLGSYPGAIASPLSGALAGLFQFFDVND